MCCHLGGEKYSWCLHLCSLSQNCLSYLSHSRLHFSQIWLSLLHCSFCCYDISFLKWWDILRVFYSSELICPVHFSLQLYFFNYSLIHDAREPATVFEVIKEKHTRVINCDTPKWNYRKLKANIKQGETEKQSYNQL